MKEHKVVTAGASACVRAPTATTYRAAVAAMPARPRTAGRRTPDVGAGVSWRRPKCAREPKLRVLPTFRALKLPGWL